MRTQGAIVGAGIIGSAIAYELTRRGVTDIHVFDPDLEGSLSSTEHNAGGVRHLWQHQVNVELARHSIRLFEKIKEEIGFHQTGYLWLYPKENAAEGKKVLSRTQSLNLQYEEYSLSKIQDRYPFIDKTEDLAFGIFGARDGLINSNALNTYYRKEATRLGATFHNFSWATKITEKNSHPQLDVITLPKQEVAIDDLKRPQAPKLEGKRETWECDFLVLSAGAWMNQVLAPLIADPLVKPYRRQMSIFKAESLDITPYGMIVDTSRVYFHPEGGNILAGFVVKEEPPGFNFQYDPNFFENNIWPALYNRSSHFDKLKHLNGWAGLYSYTPDTTGLLGKLPGYQNIFEAHSFTGRGVMQSYGAAIALAELVLDKKFQTFDAAPLSRSRFTDTSPDQWLVESLHI